MKILSTLASTATFVFALSLTAAPTFAHEHDAKSTEITHKGSEKACCKKTHDERCEKDSAYAADSAHCAKMDKEQCRKHREQCMKDSTISDSSACCKKHMKCDKKSHCKKHDDDQCMKTSAADTSSPVAKQAIKPAPSAKAKK